MYSDELDCFLCERNLKRAMLARGRKGGDGTALYVAFAAGIGNVPLCMDCASGDDPKKRIERKVKSLKRPLPSAAERDAMLGIKRGRT